MNILISNDDGWQAPGIVALAEAVQEFANIKVVAPDRNRSAASSSLTLMYPIRATEQKADWYSVDGTPADCVNLALNGLFDWQPDMVISGINAGPNLGDDVLYSGTVAAAMEGFFHGVPGLAFSLADYKGRFDLAAQVAVDVIKRCTDCPLLKDNILSINIPAMEPEDAADLDVTRLAVTRLGRRSRARNSGIVQTDPRGENVYWIGSVGKPHDTDAGTDFYAVANGEVSVTPVSPDMTDHARITPLTEWLSGGAA